MLHALVIRLSEDSTSDILLIQTSSHFHRKHATSDSDNFDGLPCGGPYWLPCREGEYHHPSARCAGVSTLETWHFVLVTLRSWRIMVCECSVSDALFLFISRALMQHRYVLFIASDAILLLNKFGVLVCGQPKVL